MRQSTLALATLALILAGTGCGDDSSTNNASSGGAGNQLDDDSTTAVSSATGLDQHAALNDRQASLNDRSAPMNDRGATTGKSTTGSSVATDCLTLCGHATSMGCEADIDCATLCAVISTQLCLPESTALLGCSASATSCDALDDCEDEFNAFVDCLGGGQIDGG